MALASAACALSSEGIGGRRASPDGHAGAGGAGTSASGGGASTAAGGLSSGVGAGGASAAVGASTSTAATGSSSSGGGTNGECVKVHGSVGCNPVTGAGCFGIGISCDWYYEDDTVGAGFMCYTSGNSTPVCQYADPDIGEFCTPGATYHPQTYRCHRYCCDDGDCAAGTCGSKGLFESAPYLGLCSCP